MRAPLAWAFRGGGVDRDVDLLLGEARDEEGGGRLLRAACVGLGLEAGVIVLGFALWRLLLGD